jgi:ribosomal-protein-alanine N-acetyltransferase
MHEVGFAPRFLHIDGEGRDHRIFAVTTEECPDGMLARLAGP